jgi:surfeit locus 1 family protein
MATPLRIPVVATIATAISLAILIGLGMWQVQRLQWKTELLARIEQRKAAPARPLEQVLAAARPAEDLEFTRVSLACPGLASARYVELYSVYAGDPGSRLVSACPLAGGRSVLVDRGFVDQAISARPPQAPSAAPVPVTGVLRKGGEGNAFTPAVRGERWFVRDIDSMAGALGAARPIPYVVAAETSSNPEWKALTPRPLPASISNSHLGYAITWFGLAAALVAVYVGFVLRRGQRADSR